MKKSAISLALLLSLAIFFQGCAFWDKTQKGTAVGTAADSGMGYASESETGNTALETIIGAIVGGKAGALIGKQMDIQAQEIKNSIPDAKVERVGEGIVVEFGRNVLFGFDQTNLTYESKTSLDNLVTILKLYKDTNIELQGHTDSKGSMEYNQNLSEKRAGSVSGYLYSEGITSKRINIKGFGETVPKYDNESEDGRSQNRRVEFLITANEKMKADAVRYVRN